MARRLLTKDYIDEIVPPKTGERWVADTAIRGFGIRIFASGTMSFCIRTSDSSGNPVRQTFNPFGDAKYINSWQILKWENDSFNSAQLSSHLTAARDWARLVIGRLKDKLLSQDELDAAKTEYAQIKGNMGKRLKRQKIGNLVDILLENHEWQGWSEDYADRLRVAFNLIDRVCCISKTTIGELNSELLWNRISKAKLSPSNLRLLRSLFNRLFDQVSDLGGPGRSKTFPERPYWRPIREFVSQSDDFIKNLGSNDYSLFLKTMQKHSKNWRANHCIEMCLLTKLPVQRVMSGSWSQLISGLWVPYNQDEQRDLTFKARWIFQEEFICLDSARICAANEGIESPFWFPNSLNPNRPISNVDRVWFSLLEILEWPRVTLSKVSKQVWFTAHQRPLYFYKTNEERECEFREIEAKMSKWPAPSE